MVSVRQCAARASQTTMSCAGAVAHARVGATSSRAFSTSSSVAVAPTHAKQARLNAQQLQKRQAAATALVFGRGKAAPSPLPPTPASLQSEEGARWLDSTMSLPSQQHPLLTFLTPTDTILQQDRLPHLKTMLEMANALYVAKYVDQGRLLELEQLIAKQGPREGLGQWPTWIEEQYAKMLKATVAAERSVDRTYRRARSLLWTPAGLDETAMSELIHKHAESMSEPLAKIWLHKTPRQEQLDVVLRPLWDALTPNEAEEAVLRARYKIARMLGWRRGYTSGFPPSNSSEREERLALLKTLQTARAADAAAELDALEEEASWEAFKGMDKLDRVQEERMAWKLRDRSMVYLDDSSSSLVCGKNVPRWFSLPQRQGNLVYLPTDTIRLVRNNTTRSDTYDAFKATFRVPLHMHKHNVRSYLLALYGLRTTWCRSMIYRAGLVRNRKRQIVRGHASQTYKKVEVGLLEPFLFPELTPAFKKQYLKTDVFAELRQRQFFKMSGRRGWRTLRKVYEEPLDLQAASLDQEIIVPKTVLDPAEESKKRREQFTIRSWEGGFPTKRHSYILKLLSERRKGLESEINATAQKLRQQDNAAQGE